jgi:hypothetical protein
MTPPPIPADDPNGLGLPTPTPGTQAKQVAPAIRRPPSGAPATKKQAPAPAPAPAAAAPAAPTTAKKGKRDFGY